MASRGVRLAPIAHGWAGNSVNVVIFRRSAIASQGTTQYTAFYDQEGRVVLARRRSRGPWRVQPTRLTGNVRDAHGAISLAVDGRGALHLAWGHHDEPLRYCRTHRLDPGDPLPMTGLNEGRVTYPEFYNLLGGDLLFLYRDGASGRGNLVMNRYDVQAGRWDQLHEQLLDGEGRRNAYWQAAVDTAGTVHLSWVWRESPDAASNHDLGYARSRDGGRTWQTATGESYRVPITASTTDYAVRIPEGSELINQTSMAADHAGRPYIATYWRDAGDEVPRFRVVFHDERAGWRVSTLPGQTIPFRLGGGGTKRLPLSRPLVLVDAKALPVKVHVVFRDEGRGNRVSVATSDDVVAGEWRIRDLTESSVGQWEPTHDSRLWEQRRQVHLFVQRAEQVDAEGVREVPPRMVYVLEWTP